MVESAVGDHVGRATLHLRQASGQATLRNDWQGIPTGETIEVSMMMLDGLIKQYGVPDFLKIDVEGF